MMRAVQVAAHGGPDVLRVVQTTRPAVAAGTVLVTNAYAGLNYIDTYHRTGLYPLPLPLTPGREAAGVVADVGENVNQVKPGDRVAWIGPGAYAEYAAVPINRLVRVPPAVPLDVAAACMLQGLTALSLVNLAFEVKPGHIILVHAAAGGTGGLLVQLGKLRGATVIATVGSAAKADEARRLGADHIIRYDEEDVAARVMALTNNVGVHCVYDGVGAATFDASLASLRSRGYLITFGNASGKVPPLDVLRLTKKNVYVARPTLFEYLDVQQDFDNLTRELFELIEQKKLQIRIHKVFDLEEAPKAHLELESRKAMGKILLQI